jgi:hypothetical protein
MYDGGPHRDDLDLQPGEIWLIEFHTPGLPALEHRALARADVVLYDRPLAPVLAELLVPGSYAEPLAATAEDGAAAIPPRALKLAADGWRVVHLGQPCRDRRRRLRGAAEAWALSSGNGGPVVRLVTKTADDPSVRATRLLDPEETDDHAAENEVLTVIVGPLTTSAAPASHAFTANGLAG